MSPKVFNLIEINHNFFLLFLRRSLRYSVQAQQGGRIFELSSLGERWFRRRLRLQYSSLRANEALRDAYGTYHRYNGLHRRWNFAQAQTKEAKSPRRRSQSRASRSRIEHARRNRRREGRHRRWHNHHSSLSRSSNITQRKSIRK